TRPRVRTLSLYICFGFLFSILVASALYTASSASSDTKATNATPSTKKTIHNEVAPEERSRTLPTKWLTPLSPLTPVARETVATYEVVAGARTSNLKNTF